jgi:RND family efflux transporter MFP subunit
MRFKKTILVSAGILSTVGGGFFAYAQLGSAKAAAEDPRQEPPMVLTAMARPAEASERAFIGVVSARVQSNLGFRVSGKITERLVDVGARVIAGQPLLRIDPKDLSLALTSRDNAVAAGQAQLVQAASDAERYSSLVAQGWATKQRYEQARTALNTARAQLQALRAQSEVARNEAGYTVLYADADGTVVETLGEPGQVVAAGQVVIRLAQAGAREATVNLPETARPALGTSAMAQIYGGAGERSLARLRQLSDSAEATTRTYEARYVLEGEAAKAPLGATVTVWLSADAISTGGALQVPLGAIFDNGHSTGVWIIDQATSTVVRRPVQVSRLGKESAVVTGLAAGDIVVALGAHLLHAGEKVRVAQNRSVAP